jgi:hypothetical protein
VDQGATSASDKAVRLPLRFDVERLQTELARVTSVARDVQPGPYHDGSWQGLSLIQAGGRQTANPEFSSLERYEPTALLGHTPYLAEVLDRIPARKQVVRLLWLPVGKTIGPHYDYDCSFRYGVLRLHLPIVTHADVDFRIGGERMDWKAGELWYGDFQAEHEVENRSDTDRVHLVADVEITQAVLDLFPPDFVRAQEANGGITRQPEYVALAPEALERLRCRFHVGGSVLPLLKFGTLPELMRGAEAEVVVDGAELVVAFDGVPTFALDAISEFAFVVRGLSAGVQLQFELGADARVSGVRLATRGVPENLMCARIGKLTEDTEFVDRITPLELVPGA